MLKGTKIMAVHLRKGDEIIYCDLKKSLNISKGDFVIVKVEQGLEDGCVEYQTQKEENTEVIGKILRKIDEKDKLQIQKIKDEEAGYGGIFLEKVAQHKLTMKLVQTHLSFDEKRLTFFFTAESRVDFRELVKDLVGTFRKLIRLQQIGPRDDAKLRGGYGYCGRSLCCQTFLDKLESITMERVREQQLSAISSSKITGLCGKLMCCLTYEEEMYKQMRKKLPKIGTRVRTPAGQRGVVINHNVLGNAVLVELEDGAKTEVSLKGENV